MSEKDENPKSNNIQECKPLASPVCYLDQFPGYFEGEEVVKLDTDDTTKKEIAQSPEP